MVGKKGERRGQHRPIGKPGAQPGRIEPGERKEARRALLAGEHPGERCQRQRLRVCRKLCGALRDCRVLPVGLVGN